MRTTIVAKELIYKGRQNQDPETTNKSDAAIDESARALTIDDRALLGKLLQLNANEHIMKRTGSSIYKIVIVVN